MNNSIDHDRKVYSFEAKGHKNILAKHFKTVEFTKDLDITERGDCIIGVAATFDKEKLKEFEKKIKLIVEVVDPESGEVLTSEFKSTVNKSFDSDHELVLRKSSFHSDRTFGFNLNRGANHLDRKIVEILQTHPETIMKVSVVEGWY